MEAANCIGQLAILDCGSAGIYATFPLPDGFTVPKKDKMVRTIEAAATACGEPLLNDAGLRLVWGTLPCG